METIIDLDDDNSDDVVEISDLQIGRYDEIMKKNRLLGEFIDKCLELDSSENMHRAFNRSLIPIYEKCSAKFQQSDMLKTIISRAICNLENAPYFKFSLISDLCQSIKLNKDKMKVGSDCAPPQYNFHRARTKITKKMREKEKIRMRIRKNRKRNAKITEIVVSDDSDGFEVPIVNLDEPKSVNLLHENETDDDVQIKDEIEIISDDQRVSDETNPNNENSADVSVGDKTFEVVDNVAVEFVPKDEEKENTGLNTIHCSAEDNNPSKSSNNVIDAVKEATTIDLSDDELINETNSLNSQQNINCKTVPAPQDALDPFEPGMFTEARIQAIENQIAHYKELVLKYEQQEVDTDTAFSPYVLCSSYKAKIVDLYQVLCCLMNENPVKRREVRFTAANEQMKLPMKQLEAFINANIGSDGQPHFPDFNDVVECVQSANIDGKMGMSKQKVMAEARTLFTYCGRALQKSRQRREWRDLLSLVKSDSIQDPADSDPALQARLQANRDVAVSKERELIDRYSQMAHPEEDDKPPPPKKRMIITPLTCDKFGIVSNNDIRFRNEYMNLDTIPSNDLQNTNTNNHQILDSAQNLSRTDCEVERTAHIDRECSEVVTPENRKCLPTDEQTSVLDGSETDAGRESTLVSSGFSASNLKLLNVYSIPQRELLIPNETVEDVIQKAIDICYSVNNTNNINTVGTDVNNETVNDGAEVKIEETFESINNEKLNNDVVANDANNSQKSTEILSHFLKAKVVLPKLTIPANSQYFSIVSDSDQNSLLIPISTSVPRVETRIEDGKVRIAKKDLTLRFPSESKQGVEEDKNSTFVSLYTSNLKSKTRSVDASDDTTKLLASCNSNNLNVVQENLDTSLMPTDTSNCGIKLENPEITIKEEPCIDIQEQLEELGENFTTTILDIEDPFLVMEISSDSSDDDMDIQIQHYNSAYL